MKITRSNYESYFLDFLEGNPDPSLMDEFQAFLKENPDLASELEMGDILKLHANYELHFDAKEELKRSVSDLETAFQEQAVAYYEGDLSLSEQKDFEASISENSAIATEAQQFGKLKLEADQSIVYANKEQLKKRIVLIPLWMKVVPVAAMLLLAVVLFFPNNGKHAGSVQLSGNFESKIPGNKVSPDVNIKIEDQEKEKTNPAVTPKPIPVKVPVKQKQTPANQKPEKKVVPVPQLRTPVTSPTLLKPRGISFGQSDDVELAVITLKDPALVSKDIELAELLKVQLAAMRDHDDRELLPTEHLGLSGLQLVARLTGKRLTARKGDDGAVHSVSYNSRLLAFSIPVNR